MTKRYITLILALLPLLIHAAPLTPQRALERALSTLYRTSVGRQQPAREDWLLSHEQYSELYVFERSVGTGFIVTPADDSCMEVLAYSADNPFDFTHPGVRAWLDDAAGYAARTVARDSSDQTTDSTIAPVAPLVQTQWNQTSPYNSQCPLSYGRRSMTGCVATAVAQIIRANRYAQSTETRNYMDGSTRRTFDFAEPYVWDSMPALLTEQSPAAEIQAVSRLMLGSGLAVNTSYAWNESGAYNEDVPYALTQYFGYNPELTVYAWRSLYTTADWDRLLRSELRAGRPLFYAGGIHAFVLDGVDTTGLYHFNWGWGGACNGYYSLLSLVPGAGGTGAGSGNFTDHQLCVRAVPGDVAQAADIFHIAGSCSYDAGGFNTLFQLAGTPHDYTVYPWLIVQDAEGVRRYAHRMGVVPLQAYGYSAGRSGQQLPLTQMELAPGEYRVYPGVSLSANVVPDRAYPMPGSQPFVLMTVNADGTAAYSNEVDGLADVPEQSGSTGVESVIVPAAQPVFKYIYNGVLQIKTPNGTFGADGVEVR